MTMLNRQPGRKTRVRLITGVLLLGLTGAGCGGSSESGASPSAAPSRSAVTWPAPADPLQRASAAGLTPEVAERLTFHVHAHLDVFVDGAAVKVPAGIGIAITDPGVKRFPNPDGSTDYGGIKGCATPCISPLHTHDGSGIVHTESATRAPNTLGQFFTEWGVRLSRSCVQKYCSPTPIAFYINGAVYDGDPTTIELTDREEIAVVIGTPPASIPKTAEFGGA